MNACQGRRPGAGAGGRPGGCAGVARAGSRQEPAARSALSGQHWPATPAPGAGVPPLASPAPA